MPWSEPGLATWVLVHAGIAALGTWVARAYAIRRRLVDAPGERRSHARTTPRGGGVAILAATLVAIAWIGVGGVGGPGQFPTVLLAAFALGTVLVGGVGWIDDHRPLSPWIRLGVHAVAAAQLAVATWWATRDPMAALLAAVAPLVLANVWNFMDGIDGIAASQALLVALVFWAWLPGPPGWLALALAAACAGFLPFNFPSARIFMGDVGSGALGFALGGLVSWLPLAVAPGARAGTMVALALLPLAAFLLDATLTLGRRMLARERWWEPHVSHAYQRLVRRTGRHWPVTVAYSVFTFGASATALALASGRVEPGSGAVTMALVAWMALGAALWFVIRRGGTSRARENME
jgi:UDP-N-acetylmuramyl pentapeptide phosphotransferase/UDP-N-acetylglucosamine-1-phosphate transferase